MRVKHLDYFLLFVVALFLILGISFLATISAPASLQRFGTTNYYLTHQLIYGFLPGIILGLVFCFLPLNFLKKISPLLLLANLIALVLVFLPQIGSRLGGASRWLNFGAISFQPSEFLKVSFILYLGSWLKNRLNYQARGVEILKSKRSNYADFIEHPRRSRDNFKQVFLPFLVFLGIISVIFYFQRNISTLGVIALTALVLYFIAGTPKWQSFLIIFGAIILLIFFITLEPYRASRFTTFLNPSIDPQDKSFQINQSLIAIGSGGIGGRGLGMSSQKFGFLPQSMSDSTFAVFAEETGFIGCIFLIFLFLMFLWLGLMIAKKAADKFSQLVALGITFWIVLQGFVNIGSMIGILPLTGIPLPFISYGGSHIASELIGVGILLNIARQSK